MPRRTKRARSRARSSELVDGAGFANALREAKGRAGGLSNEEIARRMTAAGVPMSKSTLEKWTAGHVPRLDQFLAFVLVCRPRGGIDAFRDAFRPDVWRALTGSTDG